MAEITPHFMNTDPERTRQNSAERTEPWAELRAAIRAGRLGANVPGDVMLRDPVPQEDEGAAPNGMSFAEMSRRGNMGIVTFTTRIVPRTVVGTPIMRDGFVTETGIFDS